MDQKFSGIVRGVNEGLDELMLAMEKVRTICQSAEQMSPVFKQIAKVMAQTQRAAKTGQVSIRSSGPQEVRERDSTPRRRRKKRAARPPGMDWRR